MVKNIKSIADADGASNPIRADQKHKAEECLDTLLLEGLDSGQLIPVTPEYWEEKKRRLTDRLSKPTSMIRHAQRGLSEG